MGSLFGHLPTAPPSGLRHEGRPGDVVAVVHPVRQAFPQQSRSLLRRCRCIRIVTTAEDSAFRALPCYWLDPVTLPLSPPRTLNVSSCSVKTLLCFDPCVRRGWPTYPAAARGALIFLLTFWRDAVGHSISPFAGTDPFLSPFAGTDPFPALLVLFVRLPGATHNKEIGISGLHLKAD